MHGTFGMLIAYPFNMEVVPMCPVDFELAPFNQPPTETHRRCPRCALWLEHRFFQAPVSICLVCYSRIPANANLDFDDLLEKAKRSKFAHTYSGKSREERMRLLSKTENNLLARTVRRQVIHNQGMDAARAVQDVLVRASGNVVATQPASVGLDAEDGTHIFQCEMCNHWFENEFVETIEQPGATPYIDESRNMIVPSILACLECGKGSRKK